MQHKALRILLGRMIVLGGILLLADFCLGKVLDALYFRGKNKLTYSLCGTNQDILVFGSSRANHHYDSQELEQSLGLSCFNNGQDGQNIYFHYALLESTLERYHPKIVILDITHSDFNQGDAGGLSILFPYYYRLGDTLREVVNLRGIHEKYFLRSNCYRYNSRVMEIFKSNCTTINNFDQMKGFSPLAGEIPASTSFIQEKLEDALDERKIAYVKEFIQACQRSNIALAIVTSPTLVDFDVRVIQALCNEHGVPFWDYSTDARFDTPWYFRDKTHMNRSGARTFTQDIALRMQNTARSRRTP